MVAIAAARPLLVPTVLYLGMEVYIGWLISRASRGQGGNFYSIRVDSFGPGGIATLLLPPVILLATWLLLRRHK